MYWHVSAVGGAAMNYLWENFLDTNQKNQYVRQAEIFSPYFEIMEESISDEDSTKQGGILEYNGMYRFGKIFAPLYENKNPGSSQPIDLCFDVISHFLAEMDLLKGMTKEEYKLRSLMEEIISGGYGRENGEIFRQLDVFKQYKICHYMKLIENAGASPAIFARCVTDLLEKGTVYANKIQSRTIMVYVGCSCNKEDDRLLELLQHLFLPLSFQVQIFWEHHFGLVDKNETLQYENIQII